jgi:hypothetical protein
MQKLQESRQQVPSLLALLVQRYKYCFTGTKVQMLLSVMQKLQESRQQVLSLLALLVQRYKYCFTGTKVQMLLSDAEAAGVASTCTPFTCFTGTTKVQMLVQKYKD